MIDIKITRLLEITTLLLNRHTVTSRELAERFGVSVRTIYRDVEVLSAAGVPVYMSKGNGGGISLLENYTLSKTLLSDEESGSILLALKTLQTTQFPEIDMILEKFKSVFKTTSATDWVDVDFLHWGSPPHEQDKFNAIKQAIITRQVIAFDYVNANGDKGNRAVEPLKLFYKGAAWYLIAYCRKRNSSRLFRISRIKNAITTNETFAPKIMANEEKAAMEKAPPLTLLKLKFQDRVLNRLYDDFDDTAIVRKEDGTLSIEVALPENEWLYGYLLSYGSYVEVLDPPHIRNIIIDRLTQSLNIYKTPLHI